MNDIEKWETQFRKGLIEALIMQAMQHLGQSYGYSLLVFLNERGLEITEGTLYPLLNRLNKNDWLISEWEMPSEKGHPRRVYRLSHMAQKLMPQMLERMKHYQTIFQNIEELS